MSFPFEEALASTRKKNAPPAVRATSRSEEPHVFQFQGETIYRPSGIRDRKSVRVRSSMIYSLAWTVLLYDILLSTVEL